MRYRLHHGFRYLGDGCTQASSNNIIEAAQGNRGADKLRRVFFCGSVGTQMSYGHPTTVGHVYADKLAPADVYAKQWLVLVSSLVEDCSHQALTNQWYRCIMLLVMMPVGFRPRLPWLA